MCLMRFCYKTLAYTRRKCATCPLVAFVVYAALRNGNNVFYEGTVHSDINGDCNFESFI